MLVVDDDRALRDELAKRLAGEGYEAAAVANGYEARTRLEQAPWDAVVTDLHMPGMDGVELLRWIRTHHPNVDVLLMTAHASVDAAVSALRLGAADFLTKPFAHEVFRNRLSRLFALREAQRALRHARLELRTCRGGGGLIGQSRWMREVRERIALFANHDLPVLIVGETGTGKEAVARALHEAGRHRNGPFVAVGCGAIPRDLAESELFGHEKGAFTGASSRHAGAFERAKGGTLLLDDIDDLPLELQSKLLRALQERRITRVGGERELAVDARVVATTKVDLEALSEAGRFRADLMYRLKTLEIVLPPLREREADVVLLAHHFLDEMARRTGQPQGATLTPEAIRLLTLYAWPGNVRELRACIEGAFVLAQGGPITPAHLPAPLRRTTASEVSPEGVFTLHLEGRDRIDLPAELRAFERALIDWAMLRNDGNQSRAARALGIPRSTLQSKLASRERGEP